MNFIVFDLEWNQPASWDAAIHDPIYLSGEIIEIGAVKLNEEFQTVDELRLFVIPQHHFLSRLDFACSNMSAVRFCLLTKKSDLRKKPD